MIIGLLSDTHDRLPQLLVALKVLQQRPIQVLIHAGDWTGVESLRTIATFGARHKLPVWGVFGNNDHPHELLATSQELDWPVALAASHELQLGGRSIGVAHGDSRPLLNRLNKHAEVVVRGHSHRPLITRTDNQLLINPGSTAFSIPRRRDFHGSVAVLDTTTLAADIIYID